MLASQVIAVLSGVTIAWIQTLVPPLTTCVTSEGRTTALLFPQAFVEE